MTLSCPPGSLAKCPACGRDSGNISGMKKTLLVLKVLSLLQDSNTVIHLFFSFLFFFKFGLYLIFLVVPGSDVEVEQRLQS